MATTITLGLTVLSTTNFSSTSSVSSVSPTTITDEAGDVEVFVAIQTDVTEHKNRLQQLRVVPGSAETNEHEATARCQSTERRRRQLLDSHALCQVPRFVDGAFQSRGDVVGNHL